MFKTVKKQFVTCGLEPKVHGNVQATSKAGSFDTATVICVKTFIENYAEQFGLVLPGRVPAFNNPNLMILLSSSSKAELFKRKVASMQSPRHTFAEFGGNSCHVVVQKPRTDLWETCQGNFTSLAQLPTLDDSVKEQMLQRCVEHLT